MKKNLIISGMVLLISIIVLLSTVLFPKEKNQLMSYKKFVENVNMSKVEKVIIQDNETLLVTLQDGNYYEVPNPQKEGFKEYLLLQDIEVVIKEAGDIKSMISSLLIILLIIGAVIYLRKRPNEDKQLIYDTHKKSISKGSIITFENVAGNDEAKVMVKDVVEFIQNPEKYQVTGAKMPRGILLYGLPGTGKTLLARAIAGEADAPFYAMSGSDFVQMYVGVGANRVRQLFKDARKSKKAVIFIDEIDALGKNRSGNSGSSNDEREQTLNALLTEMSGFNQSEGIVVIGATNRVDTLDPALLRPGRFDRHIEVILPDQNARKEIIKLYLKEKPVSTDVNISEIAKQTVLFSGAMLENLINEAAIIAANQNCLEICNEHLNKAFYTVIAGMERNNKELMNSEERLITAYHEAGHALIARLLLPEDTVSRISIIPTTKGAAGYNYNIPKDKLYKKKYELLGHIQVLLAGRAAEELVFGENEITTGALNDIKEASRELMDYYGKYGMDEAHGLFYLDAGHKADEGTYAMCREKMKQLYGKTKTILNENRTVLDNLVELLIQKETLAGSDVDLLIQKYKEVV